MSLPDNPITRVEQYLSNISGQGTAIPDRPFTRIEHYLDYIAKNGGGGGDGGGSSEWKEEIEEAIDSKADWITKTASGRIVSFSDGADAPLKSAVISLDAGHTGISVFTGGENLLDNTLSTQTKNGVTLTKNADGSVHVAGTVTGESNIAFDIPVTLTAGENYMAGGVSGGSPETYQVHLQKSDGNAIASIGSFTSGTKTWTQGNDANVGLYRIRVMSGATVDFVACPFIVPSANTSSISVPFPAEAGAVSNGSVDLVNKQLVAGGETYALDIPEISTLHGGNTIWTDGGSMDVTYCADTKLYVDSKNVALSVSDTDPVIVAEAGKRYVCGEVSTISITPPQSGIVDIVFTSGSSVAILTLPNTVLLPEWFDATSLDTNTVYEINIMDGVYGAVMTWAA